MRDLQAREDVDGRVLRRIVDDNARELYAI
jgi:hypothetical protein